MFVSISRYLVDSIDLIKIWLVDNNYKYNCYEFGVIIFFSESEYYNKITLTMCDEYIVKVSKFIDIPYAPMSGFSRRLTGIELNICDDEFFDKLEYFINNKDIQWMI